MTFGRSCSLFLQPLSPWLLYELFLYKFSFSFYCFRNIQTHIRIIFTFMGTYSFLSVFVLDVSTMGICCWSSLMFLHSFVEVIIFIYMSLYSCWVVLVWMEKGGKNWQRGLGILQQILNAKVVRLTLSFFLFFPTFFLSNQMNH